MTHLDDDTLLLLAYGELGADATAAAESHLTGCAACRLRVEAVARTRAALDAATPFRARPRVARWVAAGLAAAALLATVMLTRGAPRDAEPPRGWSPPAVWSRNAGYLAGGPAVVDIDAQLTRLERESSYGMPD